MQSMECVSSNRSPNQRGAIHFTWRKQYSPLRKEAASSLRQGVSVRLSRTQQDNHHKASQPPEVISRFHLRLLSPFLEGQLQRGRPAGAVCGLSISKSRKPQTPPKNDGVCATNARGSERRRIPSAAGRLLNPHDQGHDLFLSRLSLLKLAGDLTLVHH